MNKRPDLFGDVKESNRSRMATLSDLNHLYHHLMDKIEVSGNVTLPGPLTVSTLDTPNEEMVTITKAEYERLLRNEKGYDCAILIAQRYESAINCVFKGDLVGMNKHLAVLKQVEDIIKENDREPRG